MQPPECILLKKLVDKLWSKVLMCPGSCNPDNYPSYFEKGRPRGCFIAHTLLCLLELVVLKNEIANIFLRSSVKWSELLTVALLHDVGKLTHNYIKEKYSNHNVLSAAITYTLLNGKIDSKDLVKLCQAILLHHEYRHWSKLFREELAHIASTIRRPRDGLIKMTSEHATALRKLKHIAWELDLLEKSHFELLDLLSDKREIPFPKEFSMHIVSYWGMPTLQAVRIYWFLQLIDNRAASCREDFKNYWLFQFKNISKKIRDTNIKSITLADEILSRTRTPRILLSLIPSQLLRDN